MKFVEKCNERFGFTVTFEGKLVYREKSPFNDVAVFDNSMFGRVLMINDSVQLTTFDEQIYHNAMVQNVPQDAKNVLVIGGGDGGIARELRKRSCNKITIVELDKRISDISKSFFPLVWNDLDQDKRCELVFQDALKFVDLIQEPYDYCIIDLTDPDENSKDLYTKEFLEKIKCKGLSIQLGTPNMQDGTSIVETLKTIFGDVEEGHICVPSFFGGPLLIAYCNHK